MNIANKLTLFRIILVPILLVLLVYENNVYVCYAALVVFVVAAVTDLYDGRLARHRQIVTNWGKFGDPLADKILVSSVLISFVGIENLHIPAWMIAIIVSREFVVTGLRLLAVSNGIVIAASEEGKIKTTVQMITIITTLFIHMVRNYLKEFLNITPDELPCLLSCGQGLRAIIEWGPYFLMSITTFLTLITGIRFTLRHRSLFSER